MTSKPKRSKRDIVIETLSLVGLPLEAGLLGVVARATFGEAAPDTRSALCALVDAEKKRYAKDQGCGPFVVPQISVLDHFDNGRPALTPYVNRFGLSTFAIEDRLFDGLPRWRSTFLRLLDLWETGQYPQWDEKPWANPVKKAWPALMNVKFDLSEAGCAAMRREIEGELAVFTESPNEDAVAQAQALPEVDRFFGRAFPDYDIDTLDLPPPGSKSSLGM